MTPAHAESVFCAYVLSEVTAMNNATLLVIYATVNGQAERIARRIAEAAQESGVESVVKDVRQASGADLESRGSVIVVASVRFGRHARSVTRFVKANQARLNATHSAFVSVSGSAADAATRPEAEKYVREFLQTTGWTPSEHQLAGGGVPFTKYNPLIRFITRHAFAANGKVMDTHRNYDFTDWQAVKEFAKRFVASGHSRVA